MHLYGVHWGGTLWPISVSAAYDTMTPCKRQMNCFSISLDIITHILFGHTNKLILTCFILKSFKMHLMYLICTILQLVSWYTTFILFDTVVISLLLLNSCAMIIFGLYQSEYRQSEYRHCYQWCSLFNAVCEIVPLCHRQNVKHQSLYEHFINKCPVVRLCTSHHLRHSRDLNFSSSRIDNCNRTSPSLSTSSAPWHWGRSKRRGKRKRKKRLGKQWRSWRCTREQPSYRSNLPVVPRASWIPVDKISENGK